MTKTINREIAAEINPIIDSAGISDTLGNAASALAFMQEISLVSKNDSIDISIPATTGYYFIMESIRGALKFEIDNQDENRQ